MVAVSSRVLIEKIFFLDVDTSYWPAFYTFQPQSPSQHVNGLQAPIPLFVGQAFLPYYPEYPTHFTPYVKPTLGAVIKDAESTRRRISTKVLSKPVKSIKKTNIKVDAIGITATTGNVPQIPFEANVKDSLSTLILEPHAKAIVGNGGTAISTPISRAILKRDMRTRVYFNPESVAIAGVGGKAHAQADFELDFISR